MPTRINQFALVNSVCALAWQTLQSGTKIFTAEAADARAAMVCRVMAAVERGEQSHAKLLAIALATEKA